MGEFSIDPNADEEKSQMQMSDLELKLQRTLASAKTADLGVLNSENAERAREIIEENAPAPVEVEKMTAEQAEAVRRTHERANTSGVRQKQQAAGIMNLISSTFSGLFAKTEKRRTQCDIYGHEKPMGDSWEGPYPKCIKCGAIITDASQLRRASEIRQTEPEKPAKPIPVLPLAGLAVVLAILVWLFLPQGEWGSESTASPTIAETDVPNFHVVHPYLWRGATPTNAGLKRLRDLGVKTIIDLREAPDAIKAESRQTESLGMQYISLPVHLLPSNQAVSTFMDTVTEASATPFKAPVFVHCASGSSQTGLLVEQWRVKHDHWPWGQASIELLMY